MKTRPKCFGSFTRASALFPWLTHVVAFLSQGLGGVGEEREVNGMNYRTSKLQTDDMRKEIGEGTRCW